MPLNTMTYSSFKKLSFLFTIAVLLFFLASFSYSSFSGIEESCRTHVINTISKIKEHINESSRILNIKSDKNKKKEELIKEYHEARKLYKEIEFFIEYFSAYDAKYFINGPLVPKHEMEYGAVVTEPQGFQVIEECLFDTSKMDLSVLKKQYDLLSSKFNTLKTRYEVVPVTESNVIDALRLQMIRIMTLTLNGYDCTINKESVIESAYAIGGIRSVLELYKGSDRDVPRLNELMNALAMCEADLKKNPDSDSFNRLGFITDLLDPAYKIFSDLCYELKIEPSPGNFGVNLRSRSFFESNSINLSHFTIYRNDTLRTNLQAELGKLLFFDPALSHNNKRACASCHLPSKAMTDGLEKSLAFDGKGNVGRNAPTLLNVAYQRFLFHDGRANGLEEQAHIVFANPIEMNSTGDEITTKLRLSDEYKVLFRNAFAGRSDTMITLYAVLKCIIEFERTLESRNSRFDKYLNGDRSQLNQNEINGYNLFAGKALCSSCHFFPLFNSSVPPMYNDNEFEVVGTPAKKDNKTLDDDIGRQKISHLAIHQRAFKTPTLRNIALTAPYMHNGVYSTLEEVIDFYNKGGGAGLNFKIENQTLPFDSLRLNKKEMADLKSFLLTLNDTSNIPKVPKKLPVFKDPLLNKRKPGGEY